MWHVLTSALHGRTRRSRHALRTGVVVAVTAACATLALGTSAGATTPITGRFPYQDHFVDEGASAACGFPVTADVTGVRTFQVLFDRSGTPIRLQVHINGTGTMSANGIALQESDHVTEFIDLVSGNETDVGLVFREVLPGLGIVIMDRGRVTIAPDGSSVLFVAGPHPALDGDFASLCAALTP
jgi:hypothetical protein